MDKKYQNVILIYFSVLFNDCFFPPLLLFCSFLFLVCACARQTRYQELAVALDSSNLTNKQLVTKIEELVRNNPTHQFAIVFAAPPCSLGVCKVMGSLMVPQGKLLTQHFVRNKVLRPKHPDKPGISGPNPWSAEFWCWQQWGNLFLQVVMLF